MMKRDGLKGYAVGPLVACMSLTFMAATMPTRGQMNPSEADAYIGGFNGAIDRVAMKRVLTDDHAALARDIGAEDAGLARCAITEAARRRDVGLAAALVGRISDRRSVSLSSAAARALGAFALGAVDSPGARQGLRLGLRDPRREVRIAAGLTLARTGNRNTIPALREALELGTTEERIVSASHLSRMGDRRSAAGVRALVAALNPVERRRVCDALGRFGDPASERKLRHMLAHESYGGTRAHAATALGRPGNRSAVAPLVAALRDRSADVRLAAAKALGVVGDPTAVPALRRAAQSSAPEGPNAPHTDQKAREAAAHVVATLSGRPYHAAMILRPHNRPSLITRPRDPASSTP